MTEYNTSSSARKYSTYCDRRIGGVERWSMVNPDEIYMRIPDDIRDCVGFVGTRGHDKVMRYRGTAFLLSVQCDDRSLDFRPHYLVTAKHCLERVQGPLFVRLNTKDGTVVCEELKPKDDWYIGENGADVAVLRFNPPASAAYRALPREMLITPQLLQQSHVGIGDELFVTGLFTYHHGEQRNLPVLRSGMIAAMPEEPLQDQDTGERYQAYLAEMRSVGGGVSGSPVFIALPDDHTTTAQTDAREKIFRFYVLGIIRGHWDVHTRNAAVDFDQETGQRHVGMTIVTPIGELSTILDREDIVNAQRQECRELKRQTLPTLDTFTYTASSTYIPLFR